LGVYEEKGKLPEISPILQSDGIALYGKEEELARAGSQGTLDSALRAFFSTVHPGDYVAMLAYIPSLGEHEELFQDARVAIRDTPTHPGRPRGRRRAHPRRHPRGGRWVRDLGRRLNMATPILEDILQLSISERIQLVEEIWDTIVDAPEQLLLTEAQRAELDR